MDANLRILQSIKKLNDNIEETKKYEDKINEVQYNLNEVEETIKKEIEENQELLSDKQENIEEEHYKLKENVEEIEEKVKLNKELIEKKVKTINEKIDNIKFRIPKDGKDGKDGRDGKNGKDGAVGKNGKDGKDGSDGQDGVGIYDVKVNEDGELIVILTNRKRINCGVVKGKNGIGYNGVSIVDVKIRDGHLICILSSGAEIDAGVISGGGGEEVDPIFTASPAFNITNQDILNWDNKSEFSGSYNDLTDKPTIPVVPTNISAFNNDVGYITDYTETDPIYSSSVASTITQNDLTNWNNKSDFSGDYNDLENKPTIPIVPTNVSAFNNDAGYLTQHQDISGKYDKTGGEITGNVKIDGTLTLDIEDEDYDAGIRFDKRLDDNLGTVLTLTGYANGDTPTNYKPIIRNIGTPNANYDVANKKYVDDNVVVPNYYLVLLNADGTVDTASSSLNYNTISSNLTNRSKADYLDVIWGTTRFYAKCIEITDVNTGDIKFIGEVEYQGIQRYMVFTLNPNSVLTTTNIITFESISNKVQSVVSNSTSQDKYPSTKAIFDEFQRKPVVVWESNTPSEYLKGIQANLSASPAWQLTDLDLTPYKRIKIYSCAGQKSGTTASASTTPAIILEMSLDSRNAISAYGGNYVGSIMVQKPNDPNRLATLTCAVSADKTKFVVLRQTNLYGTAATGNDDVNANVFMIEGYYD